MSRDHNLNLRVSEKQKYKLDVIKKATGVEPSQVVRDIIDALTLPNFNKEFYDSFNPEYLLQGGYPHEKLLAILTIVAGLDYGKLTGNILFDIGSLSVTQQVEKPGIFLTIDSIIKILNAIRDVKTITKD